MRNYFLIKNKKTKRMFTIREQGVFTLKPFNIEPAMIKYGVVIHG